MDRFTIDIAERDCVSVLRMSGELDIAAAEVVRRAIVDSLADAPSIRVDCSDVTFIDSIGVKSLLHLLAWAGERDGAIEFSFSAPVARVLGTLGIADRFPGSVVAA